MKKYIKVLAWIAAAAFAVVSCQEKIQPHEPGEPEVSGCYGVYFPTQAASGSHVYNPTQDPSVEIKVARTNTSGSITVPVKLTSSEDGVFTLSDITFADGQEETTAVLRFDNAKDGVNYSASIQIEDEQYAAKYNSGPIALDFDVLRVQMVTLKDESGKDAKVTFYVQNDFLEDFGVEVDSYEVEGSIQYYEVDGVRYGQVVVPEEGGIWGSDAVINFTWYPNKEYVYNEESYQPVEVGVQNTGYELDGAEVGEDHPCAVLFADYYHHYSDIKGNSLGTYFDFLKDYGDSYKLSYYDGHGGFYFNLVYDIEGTNYWYGFCDGSVVGIADGYLRVDYKLKVASDYSYDGVSPISVEAGVDVASLKYACYEGELTATQVGNKIAAIADGTDASTEFSDFELDEEAAMKYAVLEVAPEKTGVYTFVAVAYDKDKKVQNSGSVVFKHIAAGDVEDHKVDVTVFTEDTPARYANYHAYDSFAYCIIGKDLTDVHVAAFPEATVEGAGEEAVFAAVKADAKGRYAVSADVLAKINGEGGYYDVFANVAAKTNYYVVVWATNGDMDEFVTATYKTEPLPYKWKSLGKGTLVDDFIVTLFGKDDITVACDVYEEETTPGLYMITGYQCALAAAFFGVDEETMAPYEGGNWNNTEVVIDATDPDAVVIEQQDYGVCVNSAYGFFLIESNPEAPGTLKDGEITFPAEELYITLPGISKTYYTNDNGTFKIVLPKADAAPAAAPAKRGGSVSDTRITKKHLMEVARPAVKFERDPKPVKVSVAVSHDRKVMEKASRNGNGIKRCKGSLN